MFLEHDAKTLLRMQECQHKVNISSFKIFMYWTKKQWIFIHIFYFNDAWCYLTLFLLGGGVNLPPPVFFLHNSKIIGLMLLKFSDFSYIPKALPLGLKPDLNTNCLSPQAHCLNDCFCL